MLSLASDNSEALPQDDAAVNTAATAVKRPWWCSLDLMVVVNASRCLCMRYVHTRSVSNRRRLMGEARFSGSWLVAHQSVVRVEGLLNGRKDTFPVFWDGELLAWALLLALALSLSSKYIWYHA